MQLPDFNKASILVIGDIMLDRYWFGEASRISPEAPVPVVKIKQIDERPGGAANVALNIASLGAKVILIGITGNDTSSHVLAKQLDEANVNHDLYHLPTMPTIAKLRVISHHQQLIRLDFEEKFPVYDPVDLMHLYKQYLPLVNLVILSDYNKGTLQNASELITLAKEKKIPVLVDPKGNDFTIYRHADVITPNLKEFEFIVGPCHNDEEIARKGQEFLRYHQIESLLLTRGERGMVLIQKNKEMISLPAHAHEVYDVTGAGDTVIAIFGAAFASEASKKDAMILANLGASLVVAKLGAASVTVAELKAALQDTPISSQALVQEDQLLIEIRQAKNKGKKIVFTNGCFDLLHRGHLTYLKQAKKLGDHLIVAVNDDLSVKNLKGHTRPINTLVDRMSLLAHLNMVDWVVSFSDNTPCRLLKKLQPDILVKGGDYTIDEVVGANIVRSYGGQVRVLGAVENISTTIMIDKLIQKQKIKSDTDA